MKLTYHPRIIKHLGNELITKDEIAISELIKNAYDAKASNICIQFFDSPEKITDARFLNKSISHIKDLLQKFKLSNLMVVEDNGNGMDYEKLKNAFFEIGTTSKLDDNNGTETLLGQKGIGRLSAQRIAPILIVETCDGKESGINVVVIDWEKFSKDIEYDAPEYHFPNTKKMSYTRLWLLSDESRIVNFENFFHEIEVQPERKDLFDTSKGEVSHIFRIMPALQTSICFLFSPFEFNNTIIELTFFYNSKKILSNINFNALKISEAEYSFEIKLNPISENENPEGLLEMKMRLKPWFLERLHRSWIKEKLLISSFIRNHTFYKELLNTYKNRFDNNLHYNISISDLEKKFKGFSKNELEPLYKILPIKGVVYAFKREKSLIDMAKDSAVKNGYILKEDEKFDFEIRDFLDENNGIKLYRNKFRIATLGNKDNDWLELQQKRTKGQQFYRFELGNVIGYVDLTDPQQKYLSETSSREHLNDNDVTRALQMVMDFIFNDRFYEFTKNAASITREILEEKGLIPKSKQKEVEEETLRVKSQLENAKKELTAFKSAFNALNKNIDLDTPDKIESTKRLVSELATITDSYYTTMDASVSSISNIEKILAIAREEQNRVKVDAYNNYKLMANGLITETITHEFHSIMKNQTNDSGYIENFKILNSCLLAHDEFEIRKNDLKPLEKSYNSMHKKFEEIELFYEFLEKTFIYKGTMDEFVNINVKEFISESILKRYKTRLEDFNIDLLFENSDINVFVPKGSLVHIFYNLIENSIYWIAYRQRRSSIDATFKRLSPDFIEIRKINDNTIQILDSGTGIKESMQDILFQSLQSGKEDGGRGMGLYIVNNFLESFDSKIRLKEDLNEYGNRYIFEIEFNQ